MMKNKRFNIKETIFSIIFLLIFMAPNFYYGAKLGLLNMTLIYSFGLSLVILSKGWKKKHIGYVFLFTVISQMCLIISFLNDDPAEQVPIALFSMLRPTLWFMVFLGLYSYFYRTHDVAKKVISLLSLLTIFMFLFNLFLMIDIFNITEISLPFYGREKFIGKPVYVNFFMVSYSAGYVSVSLYCIFFALLMVMREKKYLIFVLLSLFNILYADSKTMFIAAILATVIIFLMTSRGLVSRFISLLLIVSLFYLYKYHLIDFLNYLEEAGFRQARSLTLILTDREKSATLNVRVEQILLSWYSVSQNFLYSGSGLARNIYLESWISFYLYRYGVYGVILFLTCIFCLAFLSFSNYKKLIGINDLHASLMVGLFSWSVLLPVMLMSGPVNELEKTGFLTFSFIALLFSIINQVDKESNPSRDMNRL